jgi:hypothetical protein
MGKCAVTGAGGSNMRIDTVHVPQVVTTTATPATAISAAAAAAAVGAGPALQLPKETKSTFLST